MRADACSRASVADARVLYGRLLRSYAIPCAAMYAGARGCMLPRPDAGVRAPLRAPALTLPCLCAPKPCGRSRHPVAADADGAPPRAAAQRSAPAGVCSDGETGELASSLRQRLLTNPTPVHFPVYLSYSYLSGNIELCLFCESARARNASRACPCLGRPCFASFLLGDAGPRRFRQPYPGSRPRRRGRRTAGPCRPRR